MKFIRIAIIGFIFLSIFAFGWLISSFFRKPANVTPVPQIQNTATVLKQVQTLSELVTVKYVLEKVIVMEDAQWYGDSRVLLVAHGIVKAGIDLKNMKPNDLQTSGTKLSIRLPKAVIFDAYLDEKRTQVLERSTGMMRRFDKDLEQNARRQGIGSISGAAREMGIEKEAEERARAQLKSLFHTLGFTEVEFLSP